MKISKEFKIGIFVIVVLAATFVVINLLRGSDLLGREIQLYGRFDDVETLVASAPVQFRGYNAGSVEEVSYDPALDCFVVTCSVSREFSIPKDSRMMIYSTSIMGGKGIKLVSGNSQDKVSDGDTLQTGSEADLLSSLGAQAGPLLQRVRDIADSLQITVSGINSVLSAGNRSSLASTLSHLESTVRNAEELSASIQGKSEELNAMIDNLHNFSERFVPIADSVSVLVGNVNEISKGLAESDLNGTVDKLNDVAASASSTLDKVRDPLEKLLTDADSLINAISANPKKYIKITVF